jgi:predicted acetyltransferase
MGTALRLRPLQRADEPVALRAQQIMQEHDDFQFLLFYTPETSFGEYLAELETRRTMQATSDRVPSTFLVAEVLGEIVGRVSIRHELNDYLRRLGGHIGYGVLPEFRRRGFATEILRQSLEITSSMGLDRVLLTCDDNNAGSAKTIESQGGVFAAVVAPDNSSEQAVRQYWIG